MLTEAEKAMSKNEWVIFLAWTPHPIMASMKIHYLDGMGDSGFGSAKVYTLTRAGYARDCPNAGKLVGNLKFNLAMESAMMAPVLQDGADPKASALAWLKANPQRANFGSPAAGSLPHFFGEILSREAKADMVHVPFAGGAALMTALVGGQVSAGIDVVLEALEAHRAGKVRILATSGERRSAVLPDVPTFKESGYPGIVASGWFAMYAPARTPAASIDAINRALNKALAHPEVLDRFGRLALEAGGGSPADLRALEQASTARWAPVVKATGFRAD